MYHNGGHPEKTGYEFILEDVATWTAPIVRIAEGNDKSSEVLLSARPLYVLAEENLQWYEIDDEKDLEFAEQKIRI